MIAVSKECIGLQDGLANVVRLSLPLAQVFGTQTISFARLAQLVEHHLDTVEVIGSSPIPRTIFNPVCLEQERLGSTNFSDRKNHRKHTFRIRLLGVFRNGSIPG